MINSHNLLRLAEKANLDLDDDQKEKLLTITGFDQEDKIEVFPQNLKKDTFIDLYS